MTTARITRLYNQYLVWTEGKLQRYLLARQFPDDTQLVLALLLALLSDRLPHYGRSTAALESPSEIAELLKANCQDSSNDDRHTTVLIICSIAKKYLEHEHALTIDSEPIKLLIRTCARICSLMETEPVALCSALHAMEDVLLRQITVDDIRTGTLLI